MYWMTFWWPWPKVTAVTLINKNLLVCRIKWEPLDQSWPKLVAVSFWPWLSPDKILDVLCWIFHFCPIFFKNFGCVFQGQTLYWTYLRNGWSDSCETKRRCIGWIWVNYVTSPLTWPKVKVWNSLIWEMGWGGHGTKGMWVDDSWRWLWPMGNHGGVSGCTI